MTPDSPETVKLPRGPHAIDAYIREAGFVIAERPKHGPAIWKRGGRSFNYDEAFRRARNEQANREMLAEQTPKRGR